MSGGALDYLCDRIASGADSLATKTEEIYAAIKDGEEEGADEENALRQRARLAQVSGLMDDLSGVLRAVEWSWTGDRAFDDWEKEFESFAAKWLREDASGTQAD